MSNGEKPYRVIHVQDTVFLDMAGDAIEGVAVKVELLEFGEVTTFKLSQIKGNTVEEAVMEYLADRANL